MSESLNAVQDNSSNQLKKVKFYMPISQAKKNLYILYAFLAFPGAPIIVTSLIMVITNKTSFTGVLAGIIFASALGGFSAMQGFFRKRKLSKSELVITTVCENCNRTIGYVANKLDIQCTHCNSEFYYQISKDIKDIIGAKEPIICPACKKKVLMSDDVIKIIDCKQCKTEIVIQ